MLYSSPKQKILAQNLLVIVFYLHSCDAPTWPIVYKCEAPWPRRVVVFFTQLSHLSTNELTNICFRTPMFLDYIDVSIRDRNHHNYHPGTLTQVRQQTLRLEQDSDTQKFRVCVYSSFFLGRWDIWITF